MSPCSGPLGSTLTLIGALKWGTVWTSTSTGTGIMKGQSYSFVFYLVNFIFPVPFEVEVNTVPHFKALVNGKVEPRGQEHGGIFIL